MSDQLELNMRKVYVKPNHWGPQFHVIDEDSRTVRYEQQPNFFYSIQAALCWCKVMGVTAEVHPDCERWAA